MTQSGLSRVVNFIQISIVHERTLSQTEPSAQSGRAFNPTCRPEPIRVSVPSLRNMSGERRRHAVT